MIQEFAYLREIEAKICGPLGFIHERPLDPHSQVWCNLITDNPSERDYRAFLAGKLAEYRNAIAVIQQFDLHALNKVLTEELLAHFQMAQGVRSNLSRPGGCSTAETRFIQALQVLTIGYITATTWEYMKPAREMDANGFLAPFLSAGLTIEEVAKSAETQGITDADTFLQLLSGPACKRKEQAQPQPKDAILNNPNAVSKLEILVNAGFCNSQYAWISEGHTNFQRAMAAYLIGIRSGIEGYYAAFEDLWGCKYLSSDKAKATQLQAPKAKEKVNEISKLLDN